MGFGKAKGFRRSGRVKMGLSASGHWVPFGGLDSGVVQYAGGRGLPVWRGPSSRGVSIHKRRRISEFFRLSAMGFKEENLQEWLWMKTMGNDVRVLGECT